MPARRLDADLLKALGIVTVVLIHSMRGPFVPGVSDVEVWIGRLTRFAVPGFLLGSGLLHATRSAVPWSLTARRLRRILVPYGVASLAAQAFHLADGAPRSVAQVLQDLLLASSFGPYYYVLIALGVVLLAPLLARVGSAALATLLILGITCQGLLESGLLGGSTPSFWPLRNPLVWVAYYVSGWMLRLHEEKLRGWLVRYRAAAIAATAGSVVALAVAQWHQPALLVAKSLSWLDIYATLALLLATSFAREAQSTKRGALRGLSDASYSIYLFHLPFVIPASRVTSAPDGVFDPLAVLVPWAIGLAGSWLLVVLARTLLGARSRAWIGA